MPASQGKLTEWHPRPDFQSYMPGVAPQPRTIMVSEANDFAAFIDNEELPEIAVYDQPLRQTMALALAETLLSKTVVRPANAGQLLQAYVDGCADEFDVPVTRAQEMQTIYVVTQTPLADAV